MNKIIVCTGIPCSGKSTWSKEELRRNPNAIRVNRDDIRALTCNSVYSTENESLAISIRDHIISKGLKQGRDIIVDDCNINRRNFEDICKLADKVGVECMVLEKPFYVDIDEALERNSKREGVAKVPEEVIHKMWKQSGKESHKFYKPRTKICGSKIVSSENIEPAKQDKSKEKLAIFDVDGTVAKVNGRSPYDTAASINDYPIEYVIDMVKFFHSNGVKIIFCTGRDEQYRDITMEWLNTYVNVPYELYMRPNGDKRKDFIIKEEVYNNHIKDKYNLIAFFDNRARICEWLYKAGLPLFRVGDPLSTY